MFLGAGTKTPGSGVITSYLYRLASFFLGTLRFIYMGVFLPRPFIIVWIIAWDYWRPLAFAPLP